MMNYNLGVLNDKEFENLCKDLLEVDLGIKLQNFSRGRDKGIDLRYSIGVENKIIIQCKHYWNSKFSDLKSTVAKEKNKVKKLRPKRYILITSLSLSSGQVDELLEILNPYCKSSNDIYGFDRLNALIQSVETIEKKYFKLWNPVPIFYKGY